MQYIIRQGIKYVETTNNYKTTFTSRRDKAKLFHNKPTANHVVKYHLKGVGLVERAYRACKKCKHHRIIEDLKTSKKFIKCSKGVGTFPVSAKFMFCKEYEEGLPLIDEAVDVNQKLF